MVTDDLSTYNLVVDRLRLGRQVCVVHVRKNVAQRLRKVKGRGEWKSRLRSLLDDLPDNGDKRLMDMEREAREESARRRLAVDLCAKWSSLVVASLCATGATQTSE